MKRTITAIMIAATLASPMPAHAATVEELQAQVSQLQLALDQQYEETRQWETNYDVADTLYRETAAGCAVQLARRDRVIAGAQSEIRKQRRFVRQLRAVIRFLRNQIAG